MPKKILFVFAGTGVNAKNMRDFMEGTEKRSGESFNDDVIRVYFNGCQDKRIGEHNYVKGLLNPNLDQVATKLRKVFTKGQKTVQFSIEDLKKEFGDAIIIEPQKGLSKVEEVDDITLNGFSRGAVTTFAVARALDNLDTPMSLLAEDPVPGDARKTTYNKTSLYAKNVDLSACKNIVRGEVLLGTYSKHNRSWQNKWFRQMAPKFDSSTDSHIFMVPKKQHVEFNRMATTYSSSFLFTRGLTSKSLSWDEDKDRAYVIPKVEQQKFHFGVVGRAQYLPDYKQLIYSKLYKKYNKGNLCPIDIESKFKSGQALLIVFNAAMDKSTFDELSKAVLEDNDKGKGLREFIVEFNSIVQYSKEQSTLETVHVDRLNKLETDIYKTIANYYKLVDPSVKQQKMFEQSIQTQVNGLKGNLPNKTFDKLSKLTTLFLKENTLTHPHLVRFIDESETFASSLLTADQPMLDGKVRNAEELSQKLFHSSIKQRSVVFTQEKQSLSRWISNAADLANVAQFLTPAQLKEILMVRKEDLNKVIDCEVGLTQTLITRIKTIADVLLIMNTLPTEGHRTILYSAVKDKLVGMKPTFAELIQLMEHLPEKNCQELCNLLPIKSMASDDSKNSLELMKHRLSSHKINMLTNAAKGGLSQSSAKDTAEPASSHQMKVTVLNAPKVRFHQPKPSALQVPAVDISKLSNKR